MLSTVTNKLREEKIYRKSLGNSRADHGQRVAHLVAISQRYQDLAKKSLSNPDSLADADMKLRGQSKKATQTYTQELISKGHFYDFLEIGKSVDVPLVEDSDNESDLLSTVSGSCPSEDSNESTNTFSQYITMPPSTMAYPPPPHHLEDQPSPLIRPGP